jgi:hypothetical protein
MLGKIIRIAAIILLGLTAVFSLLGGIGSTCVAFAAENWESMAAIVPFKWLYMIYVVLTIAASLYAVRATVNLVRNRPGAYREAILAILACLLLATAQVISSRLLRGKSMPNDIRVYVSFLALVVFLLLRIPRIWQQSGLDRPNTGGGTGLAAGPALFLSGVTVLTVHLWAGPTHSFGRVNFADVWHIQLTALGWALIAAGLLALGHELRRSTRVEKLEQTALEQMTQEQITHA